MSREPMSHVEQSEASQLASTMNARQPEANSQPTNTIAARHVCIKVPGPKDELRGAYLRCDRESWVKMRLGADGQYVGRPKNDGGWYLSPTVKAGSVFANPFSLRDYSLDESLRLFTEYMNLRASVDATTEQVIALLPSKEQRLAEARFAGGTEREAVGKSVAHMRLSMVGLPFKAALEELRGKRLGCFCDEASPCHAKVLAALCQPAAAGDKRKRDE